MNAQLTPVSSELFTRCTGRVLVADISDLPVTRVSVAPVGAANENKVAFVMRNPKTKNEVTWVLYDTKHDEEGEVYLWVFRARAWDVLVHPGLEGWEVHLLND